MNKYDAKDAIIVGSLLIVEIVLNVSTGVIEWSSTTNGDRVKCSSKQQYIV